MIPSQPSFRAAVVQTLASLGDVQENIRLLEHYTLEAKRQGAKLIVFPECMNSGYLFDDIAHARQIAEPLDGPFATAMQRLCREHDLYIASGFTELGENAKIYNSGLFYGPDGQLLLHYQKQFLATHDQNWFDCGIKGNPVVETPLGNIGLLICFDGRIPEIARSIALQGADVVLDMANFFAMDQADLWVPARAMENGIWIVAATKAGVERSIHYPGGSMIVAPDGDVKAYVPKETHGVVSWTIDVAAARDKRWLAGGDRFADRAPETYGCLTKAFENTPLAAILEQPLIPEKATTKLAVVQDHAVVSEGVESALDMVEHAARLGAKLIVTPAFFACPSWLPDAQQARDLASQQSMLLHQAAGIAQRWQTHIVLDTVEEQDGALYHTALLVGPSGQVLSRYRQVHVEPEIRDWCTPGQSWTVTETQVGRVGMMLGYDGRFPESSRELALLGADIIAWPTALREKRERDLLAVPKAEDNRIYLAMANRTDAPFAGGSLVVPPNGFPLWELDQVSPVVTRKGAVIPTFANLALSRQKFMIPRVNMLRNRLVETYESLRSQAAA
ncbi:Predicted amidohydrolase [Ectothiorhodosinus mongolicus]|uniref:Predicted amidohydrolase n=1 Tax=Ectothiorhodosinus mongolicus TaxID=233100 RepID=A0A1R3W6T5_9GAMM|nr:carbon-nitrogen hydrolase family protein [Ectothiorhodosinus mongolicus]ULX57571.1 carbon-nitrogen hydrolase family protein [Ectothiorhodosinus mongolicus]SIT72877.1 Predicted amidohydrolase [Ectothiorhodosinus mongolicus]